MPEDLIELRFDSQAELHAFLDSVHGAWHRGLDQRGVPELLNLLDLDRDRF